MTSSSDSVTIVGQPASFVGELAPPGDKSISHRALLFGALASGTSTISHLSLGLDVLATIRAISALGVKVTEEEDYLAISSSGLWNLTEPKGPIDVGNSGTLMRLLPGVLSGLDGHVVIYGDRSVNARPMSRITDPLSLMGVQIDGRLRGGFPPISIRGGPLDPISYSTPVASAQVKSAVLLAGLYAQGTTVVEEAVLTRPHTEEFLGICGVPYSDHVDPDGRHKVSVSGTQRLLSFDVVVPGDPSQGAFWAVGAVIRPGSHVVLRNCYDGSSRNGYLSVLQRMGADIVSHDVSVNGGFPLVDLVVRGSSLVGCEVSEQEVSTMIDEIPILCVAAAFADGDTVFRGLGELRVKESDRIATTASLLRSFGGSVEEGPDFLVVHGEPTWTPKGAIVDSGGDHRIAMSAAIMAAGCPDEVAILGFDSVGTSYRSFASDYLALTGRAIQS